MNHFSQFWENRMAARMKLGWVFNNDENNIFNGLGVFAASRIPSGTKVMCHHGKVVSKEMVRKTPGCVCSHLCNADGTGCAIDGQHSFLFNGAPPDVNQIHHAPAPLMSLTNSLRGRKDSNCRKVVDIHTAREHLDDFKLSTTIWLETTRDIKLERN